MKAVVRCENPEARFANKRLKGLFPVGAGRPRILILGSMPSVLSLGRQEYYGNPLNDFWTILAAVFGASLPETYPARKKMLSCHRIALWDVIRSCRRTGSLDANIRDAAVNDIPGFLKQNPGIRLILLNGKTAENLFLRYFEGIVTVPFIYVPSSSRANTLKREAKIGLWKKALASGRPPAGSARLPEMK